MFFDQIFNSGAQRDISEATAQQWADATWGAGNRPIEPAEDMSDQYNTKLSDEQEGQFLQWARDTGRESDVRDYDLRGAWLEMQNGSMTEDDRGHLGDRYKKPNHPTFSAESIYNGEGGVTGGEWTTVNGVQTYTPGRKLTRNQAERLRGYFEQFEVGSVLNLDDKIFDDEPRDSRIQAPRDPSLFDGILSDAWKAIPNAAVRMGTTALTVASEFLPEHGNAQNRAWIRENIVKSMRESAVKLDEWNRKNLGPDPEEMGKATQVIYGLLNTLPEIAVMMSGVGSVARLALGAGYKASRTSLAVGSALFGTDLGVAERNRLISEDADPSTARIAGWASGVLNTVGVAIPPFLGASRTWSAIYGAGTNVGLNIAEIQGIKFILENSNYAQLAQQYELNLVDSFVAAGLGAAMGAAFWRNPTAVKYEKAQLRLKDRYRADLLKGGIFSKEESAVQADINSRAVMSLARANGIAPDQIDSFAAKITWSKDSKSLSVPGEYAMPFTQGREWQFGDRAEKNPDYKVKVVRLEKENAPIPNNQGLAELIESYRGENGVRLENDTTGWRFSIGANDKKEIIHGVSESKGGVQTRSAMVSVLKHLPEIVKNAFPAESYRDIKAPQGAKGVDDSLKGIHRFYSPVVVGDGEYLVKITVKDRASDGGKKSKDRLSVYQIVGVEIEKAQPKAEPVSSGKVTDASAEGRPANRHIPQKPVASRYPSDEITVREMLSGVKRDGDVVYVKKTGADGKEYWAKDETRRTRFFTEEPNQWAYEEKGGYWKDPNDQSGDLLQISDELFQLAYHGSPYVFDTFTLSHIGSGEGAQVHGWGLYFALERTTAEGYLRDLAPDYVITTEDGRTIKNRDFRSITKDPTKLALWSCFAESGEVTLTAEQLKSRARERLSAYLEVLSTVTEPEDRKFFQQVVDSLRELIDSPVAAQQKPEGRLYTVDIPEDDVMLRENATFKNQPKKVRDALRKIFASADKDGFTGAFMEQWEADDSLGMKAPAEAVNKIRKKYGNSPEAIERIRRLVGRLVREHYKGLSESEKRDYALKDAVHDMTESVETFLRNWTPREMDPEGPRLEDITGKEIYERLVDRMGSPKAASEILRDHGVLGVRYYGAIDGECAVVWDEASIKILHELEQAMGRDGSIRGAFQSGNNTIRLTPNANLSTFSHEHAHWYLTNIFRLAGEGGASIDIQAQTLAILDAFGIKSLQDWQALGAKGQEKYQEQFAAWTEIYLSEGKSPLKELEGVFAKLGQWLTEMYRELIGKDTNAETDPARKSVGDIYESRFNEKLPELSPQVRDALDRMYGAQKKILGFKASTVQTAAARVIQSSRVNSDKTSAPIQDSQGPTAQFTARDTQGKAASDLQKGEKVDVAETFADAPENQPVVTETQNTFARGVSVGTGESARTVVLQNRNRSDPNSVAQMNSIAADPQYGRLSTSRTTQSGAPMVSFGRMPDSRYQGKTETVTESNGNKIPVTYYVVEADSVLRSNNYDGTPNKEWNEENPDRMRVIAGNGRMAGLSEAYNRGTAENYRNDLIADEASHGISADAIRSMKHPVLVRYMPPDRVTTGFVERSNTSDVLVRSALETAVQDSPKIRKNIDKYEFDDDGDPTKETLGQFLSDVGEISEMGNLIGSDGQPTTTARNRIRAALFYEAYRDRVLTELVADSEDKQGIKRILNAMSAFAPRVIQIREASKGDIDLAPFITGAAHRILQAKINGEGVDFTSQVDMFNSDPATDIMTEFFSQNRNSAAGMLRVLRPFAESVQNAMQAADSPLFGDLAVKTDIADAIGLFRKAQNDEIRARSGNVLGEDPSGLLPEIDVNAIRKSVEAAAKAAKEAAQLTKTMAEEAEKVNEAATPQAQEARAQEFAEAQERARNVLSDDSVGARALNLTLEDPQRMTIVGENAMTTETVIQERAQVDKQVSDDAAGIGTGIACIIRNGGIKQ